LENEAIEQMRLSNMVAVIAASAAVVAAVVSILAAVVSARRSSKANLLAEKANQQLETANQLTREALEFQKRQSEEQVEPHLIARLEPQQVGGEAAVLRNIGRGTALNVRLKAEFTGAETNTGGMKRQDAVYLVGEMNKKWESGGRNLESDGAEVLATDGTVLRCISLKAEYTDSADQKYGPHEINQEFQAKG